MATVTGRHDDAVAEARRRYGAVMIAHGGMERLTVSEWAAKNITLERGASPDPGEWDNSRAPYQIGMMDAVNDPEVEDIVYMTSAQVGKTTVILNIGGYFMDQDPCPILAVLPTVELGEVWSKDRLQPMIRNCPPLRDKVGAWKSRDSNNTILHRRFPGGQLAVVGANAPSSLAMRPVRVVLCDEVDRFPASAGSEGDPVALAFKRTENYYNRKRILTSSPTIRGMSRIEEAWLESDQRRFYVPCPKCDTFQVLKWNPADGKGGVVFKRDEEGKAVPASARYECAECKYHIENYEKDRMLQRGEWRATYPERTVRGFHINALYSPWRPWSELVGEWDKVKKNPERLKVFVNTVLGETWEETGEGVEIQTLKARIEKYAGQVPRGVGALVCAVDVQQDRFEIAVKGFGEGEESWLIEHSVLAGDPGHGKVWDSLDTFLRTRRWKHENGKELPLDIAVIDSSFQTDMVYRFTGAREEGYPFPVFPLKGAQGPREVVGKATRSEKYRVKLFVVGVDTAKDLVFSRLRQRVAGPGYMHLPHWVEEEYLEQLTAERAVRRWHKGRGWVREWVKTRERNEALDLEVYSLAGLRILGTALTTIIGARAVEFADAAVAESVKRVEKDGGQKMVGRARPRGSGWVNRWRR